MIFLKLLYFDEDWDRHTARGVYGYSYVPLGHVVTRLDYNNN